VLGKTPLTKKAQEKSLTSTEQNLMAGPNCQAGQGKMAQQQFWARHGFFRRGRLRKLAHVWFSGRGGAVLEHRNFCSRTALSLGVSQVRSEDKMAADLQMATLLFYQKAYV
jgi:hypothetical protein